MPSFDEWSDTVYRQHSANYQEYHDIGDRRWVGVLQFHYYPKTIVGTAEFWEWIGFTEVDGEMLTDDMVLDQCSSQHSFLSQLAQGDGLHGLVDRKIAEWEAANDLQGV